MKKWIVFVLVSVCVLCLWGHSKKETDVLEFDDSTILCPNCGHVRKKGNEDCLFCEARKELVEKIIAETQVTEIPLISLREC